ncbi:MULTISPECIES: hypothetical protein [unclassified Streptomyces]|uniref:hypothetical protein n=1 Tax=unclassified Streptomyces TaxID=2593676 RepID=UPI003D9259D5
MSDTQAQTGRQGAAAGLRPEPGKTQTPATGGAYRTGKDKVREGKAMRLVFEDNEKPAILEQAAEAEEAGKQMLADSLRGMAENGVDFSRDWETLRVELYATHGIDVTGDGGDACVA